MTPLCRFESHDPAMAEVTADGVVQTAAIGSDAHYRQLRRRFCDRAGHNSVRSGAVKTPSPARLRRTPNGGIIDEWIDDQLSQLNLQTAAAAEDAQFLRRVTLDTVGRLPTSVEIHQFLESSDPQKRSSVIDRLLSDPQHASLWATRLCDLTGCRLETMEGPGQTEADAGPHVA